MFPVQVGVRSSDVPTQLWPFQAEPELFMFNIWFELTADLSAARSFRFNRQNETDHQNKAQNCLVNSPQGKPKLCLFIIFMFIKLWVCISTGRDYQLLQTLSFIEDN